MNDTNNLDPCLFTVLRKGTDNDRFIHRVEPQQVQNGKILLSEIPQKQYRIKVSSSDGRLWYEIDNGTPKDNEYLVDYNTGLIYFSSDHEAETLTFDYLGIGLVYVSSKRIYTDDNGNSVTETLQQLINSNRVYGNVAHKLLPVQTFEDIATTYPLPLKGDMVQVLTGEQANRMFIFTGKTWQWFLTFPFEQVEQNRQDISVLRSDLNNYEETTNESLQNLKTETAEKFNQLSIRVTDYGAKGDGATDDGEAILKAHQAANNLGVPVFYPKATYFIKDVDEIPVTTSIDFGGSTIIYDVTSNPTQDLYVVQPDQYQNLSSSLAQQLSGKIKTDIHNVQELRGYGNQLVRVTDTSTKIGIRYGINADSGINKSDIFCVDNYGNILDPIMFDYSNITTVEMWNISDKRITIKNGTFIERGVNEYVPSSPSNPWQSKGFLVNRSKTDLINLTHKVETPSRFSVSTYGFFHHLKCSDVKVINCTGQARPFQFINGIPAGTYDIFTSWVNNITYDNFTSETLGDDLWGIMGGNQMKNVIVKNSKINRFDTHIPSQNIHIMDSVIGDKGIEITGYGQLIIERCKIYCNNLVTLREDYGSTWFGDIFIKDVELFQTAWGRIFNVIAHPTHNFGYSCTLGHNNVHVENVNIHNDYDVNATEFPLLSHQSINENELTGNVRYTLARQFEFINCGITNGGFCVLSFYNLFSFRGFDEHKFSNVYRTGPSDICFMINGNVKILIDNCKMYNFGHVNTVNNQSYISSSINNRHGIGSNYTDDINNDMRSIIPEITFNDCGRLYIGTRGYPTKISVTNGEIASCDCSYNGCRTQLIANDCRIYPHIDTTIPGTLKIMSGNSYTFFFNNCHFILPIDQDGQYIKDMDTITQIYNFFNNTSENVLYMKINMSNCTLDYDFDPNLIKQDFNDYGWKFGNINAQEGIPRKVGNTSQLPPNAYNHIGTIYRNTETNQTLIYLGGDIGYKEI